MARIVDSVVHFDDGSYATLEELVAAGETVSPLTSGLVVFSLNGKTFQSDGASQTAVDSAVASRLSTLETDKAAFMPSIVAARG